ncbi:MAG: type II toxin-antitoxin system RelE/ParE family toxin [Planctomycetota bacterium]
MPRELVHDKAAQGDLIGIWVYSFEAWGAAQADRYLDALEVAIRKVVDNSEDGKQRDALRPGYWSKRLEHHVVFYTLHRRRLRVRRVLHEVMDPGSHF